MYANSPKAMLITTALSGLVAYSNNPVLHERPDGVIHAAAIGLGATFLSQTLMAYSSVNFLLPLVKAIKTPAQRARNGLAISLIGTGALFGGAVIGHQTTEAEVLKNLRLNEKTIIQPSKPVSLGYYSTSLFSLT